MLDEEVVVVRVMDDDNSCLFRSIAYTCLHDIELHFSLRQVVVNAIKGQPTVYSKVLLDKEPAEYCEWILKANSWGGAIELKIFAEHFKMEITSVDVQTLRCDRFGEDQYKDRVMVLYSGIHYDAIALSPFKSAPAEFDQTVFTLADQKSGAYLAMAVDCARELQSARKFVDLANFTLKCSVCKEGLKGQKEAQDHALSTGHAQYEEY